MIKCNYYCDFDKSKFYFYISHKNIVLILNDEIQYENKISFYTPRILSLTFQGKNKLCFIWSKLTPFQVHTQTYCALWNSLLGRILNGEWKITSCDFLVLGNILLCFYSLMISKKGNNCIGHPTYTKIQKKKHNTVNI